MESLFQPMCDTNFLSESSVVVVTSEKLSSNLDRETIVLDIQSGVYFGLNYVGSIIWEMIQQPKKVSEIRNSIADKYSVSKSQCEADILELLQELLSEGLIEIKDAVAA